MTTRDNDNYPDDRVDPLDDNRLVDGDRPLDQDQRADDDRMADDSTADAGASADRTDDETLAADSDPTTDTEDATDRTSGTGLSADDPLVPTEESVDFKARWDVVQQGFVDDPRAAVTDADKLVSDVLQRLSATFDQQHQGLESQWANGEPSTEDLRAALQRYRAFFDRLLTL